MSAADFMCRASSSDEQSLVSRHGAPVASQWTEDVVPKPSFPAAEGEDKGVSVTTPTKTKRQLYSTLSAASWLDVNPVAIQVALMESYFRLCGLEPCVVAIDSETHIHCWVPQRLNNHHQPQDDPWYTQVLADVWSCLGRSMKGGKDLGAKRQPVLLLHGFGASAIWQWMHQVWALQSSGFDVFMPDLVFFGGSWSASTERSVEFQAECMVKLMDAFGISTFHVNGISYGGFVAYRMATMYPQRVRSLVMTNSGLLVTDEELQATLELWRVKSTSELLLPTDADGVQRLMDLAFHKPLKPPSWLLKKALPALFESMVQEKRELLEHLSRREMEGDGFQKPTMKTLLMWGRHDKVFPVAVAQRMQRFFENNTKLVVLEDSSHVCNGEQFSEYNDAIIAFMVQTRSPNHCVV